MLAEHFIFLYLSCVYTSYILILCSLVDTGGSDGYFTQKTLKITDVAQLAETLGAARCATKVLLKSF